MKWTITIPRELPSRNKSDRARRWGVGAVKARWAADARHLAKAAGIPFVTETYRPKRRLTITRLYAGRGKPYDERNIDDKTLVDALKPPHMGGGLLGSWVQPGAALIVDDSPQWIEISVKQERAADGKPGTRIELEDLP